MFSMIISWCPAVIASTSNQAITPYSLPTFQLSGCSGLPSPSVKFAGLFLAVAHVIRATLIVNTGRFSQFPRGSEPSSIGAKICTKPSYKRGIYARAVGFVLFESIFLSFAYYCLFHPILIQSKPSDTFEILSAFNATLTEAKSATAATAVVWQAIACLFIKDVISIVRSAEFMAQYRQLGELAPGVSDRVSTITSGVIDGLVHFIGDSSTGQFRLVFIAMLVLMSTGPLGSATITVGTTILHTTKQIEVANVTSPSGDGYLFSLTSDIPDVSERTNIIMRLENTQHTVFGYQMSLGPEMEYSALIPWPRLGESLGEESTLTYHSDVLRFSFQCSWTTPKLISWNSDGVDLEVNGWNFSSKIDGFSCFGKSTSLEIGLLLTQLDY
ncbi:hypothetical protein NP233_g1842 [Leucocoprinus birnbaumii]|uniref:Uncharacterized protein n=1 Tax=Leucocoprinus birnbaumii TaxID=56174 RepID=A0AAD5W2E3_9AGAR|nr:hypothetical protein NP233_g1842 [Leucocoprinus birnbaumii]